MLHYRDMFLPGRGTRNFFIGVLIYGIAHNCLYGVLNNYLVDIQHFTEYQRGVLEFFRELPGLLLIGILALLHRASEWKILRIGALVSICGIAGLLFVDVNHAVLIALIAIYSAGEHIIMPARSAIAMHIAHPGKAGRSLGLTSGTGFLGQVVGGLFVAGVFFFSERYFPQIAKSALYNFVWIVIIILLGFMILASFPKNVGNETVKRPRLYFKRKCVKYYFLEVFYGARKQIFLTFAPFVLILIYGIDTAAMALLVGICAGINIFAGTLIGKLIDHLGYRNIMIYDTVILFFVCLVYGFADKLFPMNIALWAVVITYILDAIISTASAASCIYVREISDTQEEVTATMTTGISVNHLISVLAAFFGGWLWQRFGVGYLFIFAAVMALANTAYAITLPKPKGYR
ncbi:MAG: MFS transporter [Victivallales bacterium]|jgi:MFS family permease|nr:MFS transporter [Victivallales bacterium]